MNKNILFIYFLFGYSILIEIYLFQTGIMYGILADEKPQISVTYNLLFLVFIFLLTLILQCFLVIPKPIPKLTNPTKSY